MNKQTEAMKLHDSRRLTGINVVSDVPGAVVDVALAEGVADLAIAAWQDNARAILDAVGWAGERTIVRRFAGGASLQISAPIDGWYAACEVNEWAWEAARAALSSESATPLADAAQRLRRLIADESNSSLLALRDAAIAHGVTLLADDEVASVGLGRGSRRWAVDALPEPEAFDWNDIHDIPVVLITGTNGKTTTARLLARMVVEAQQVPGNTSTDGVQIGGEFVLRGDYTGGEGARAVLQDRRVDIAILETARGGMLRRGLPVREARAALVTNVGFDHLGEFGVANIDELADTKMLVTRAVDVTGTVVLNADDAALVARAGDVRAPIAWISRSGLSPIIKEHTAAGGEAFYVRDRRLVRVCDGRMDELLDVEEVPITLRGAAQYNVYNALGAAALAFSLDLPRDAVLAGLRGMRSDDRDNPGRGNLFEVDGARVFVDFAHNPPGIKAVVDMALRLPANRRLVVLGQAGDRDDDAIRSLARAAWQPGVDHVIVKDMPRYWRGREAGEVPALIADELYRSGAPTDAVEIVGSELEAVQRALAWARPGDLLLLLLQERTEGVALLQEVGSAGWAE